MTGIGTAGRTSEVHSDRTQRCGHHHHIRPGRPPGAGKPAAGHPSGPARVLTMGRPGRCCSECPPVRWRRPLPRPSRLMWFYEPGEAPPCGHRSPAGNG
jgi:hypothetical protein